MVIIHPPVDGILCCFQLGAIINRADLNILKGWYFKRLVTFQMSIISKWINKFGRSISWNKHYLATKRNELLVCSATWTDLKNMMARKSSHPQKRGALTDPVSVKSANRQDDVAGEGRKGPCRRGWWWRRRPCRLERVKEAFSVLFWLVGDVRAYCQNSLNRTLYVLVNTTYFIYCLSNNVLITSQWKQWSLIKGDFKEINT